MRQGLKVRPKPVPTFKYGQKKGMFSIANAMLSAKGLKEFTLTLKTDFLKIENPNK